MRVSTRKPGVTAPTGPATPKAPAPKASGATVGASSPAGSQWDGTRTAPPTLPAPTAPSASQSPLGIRLQHTTTGAAAVHATLQQARARLGVSLAVLPDAAEASLTHALDVSASRIAHALDNGSITLAEATQAANQVSDMLDVLLAVQQGKANVVPSDITAGSGVASWELRTTGGDAVRISVRSTGSAQAQARVKLQNIADNGQVVPAANRLMVRFDLEGSELDNAATRATWDVAFGSEMPPPGVEKLDKRIHGIMLGEDGQPLLNRGGRTIPDHHFHQDVPDALNDPEGFRAFTEQFLDAFAGTPPGNAAVPS